MRCVIYDHQSCCGRAVLQRWGGVVSGSETLCKGLQVLGSVFRKRQRVCTSTGLEILRGA